MCRTKCQQYLVPGGSGVIFSLLLSLSLLSGYISPFERTFVNAIGVTFPSIAESVSSAISRGVYSLMFASGGSVVFYSAMEDLLSRTQQASDGGQG